MSGSETVALLERWIKRDEVEVYVRTWTPVAVSVRATVLFVHGFGEHCSRYNHVFNVFAAHGIKTTSFDQRGFGQTGRRGGILGHHVPAK